MLACPSLVQPSCVILVMFPQYIKQGRQDGSSAVQELLMAPADTAGPTLPTTTTTFPTTTSAG